MFDWDDTILPRSWLENHHALTGDGVLRPEAQRQMASLIAAAAQTLELATTLGIVIIITNSAPGWVRQSCQLFMPQLFEYVYDMEAAGQIFAKPMYTSPVTFKNTSFARECQQFRNLVSLGDGERERTAIMRLQETANLEYSLSCMNGRGLDRCRRLKSVKLIDSPTCQQLVTQLEMLQSQLEHIVSFQGSLDLKAWFAPVEVACSAVAPSAGRGRSVVARRDAVEEALRRVAKVDTKPPQPRLAPGDECTLVPFAGAGLGGVPMAMPGSSFSGFGVSDKSQGVMMSGGFSGNPHTFASSQRLPPLGAPRAATRLDSSPVALRRDGSPPIESYSGKSRRPQPRRPHSRAGVSISHSGGL